MSAIKRFSIRTFGCQMNVHDTEKLSNLLYHAGYEAAANEDQADLLVINTCSVREKAENKLYSDLGRLREWKAERPGRLIGVGGCVAQQEGQTILRRFNHVDLVFGTHNLLAVPAMLDGAAEGHASVRVDESVSLARFDLPERHPAYLGPDTGHAFVTVMEGCDMFCSFCVVPRTRGREISRPAASIVDEVQKLVARGVSEITLLGQTVNAYGRHDVRRGAGEARGTIPFAALLRRLDAIDGLRRIRYTSPHPLFFDQALLAAHGDLEKLCPHVHMPVQSGSDPVLERMRRRYTRSDYLGIIERLRALRTDVVVTTDLIVGFPGESDAEFRETLSLIEEIGFVDSYSFKYSRRPGTKALEYADVEISPETISARLSELQDLQRKLTLEYHFSRVGKRAEIRVEGASLHRAGQIRGRDLHHRVVNVNVNGDHTPHAALGVLEPGRYLEVEVVEATPHSLIGVPTAELLPISS
ncbi:MAG: tRNA (N6-isopentenyl adenosine(37)-C2)-methylthiotransferase MiaB [Myxococcales bacterium]|nr:tRNA (N6-isopentenyl adenosine(37)-C2)-methylthiotransferase MiaB [Myxococcales bacterium]